jgi:hypothetical protein
MSDTPTRRFRHIHMSTKVVATVVAILCLCFAWEWFGVVWSMFHGGALNLIFGVCGLFRILLMLCGIIGTAIFSEYYVRSDSVARQQLVVWTVVVATAAVAMFVLFGGHLPDWSGRVSVPPHAR